MKIRYSKLRKRMRKHQKRIMLRRIRNTIKITFEEKFNDNLMEFFNKWSSFVSEIGENND